MSTRQPTLLQIAPASFVLIWSTGWIVAKFAAPFADPLTFISLRFLLAGFVLVLIAMAARAAWPQSWREAGHALLSGVMLHGIYLSGIWWAIAQGLPAGISALIAAIQPILTALLAPVLLGEAISWQRWAGIGLGFAGLTLAIAPKLVGLPDGAFAGVAVPIMVNVGAMLAVTAATFHQKRFIASGDLRTVSVLQYAGGFAFTLPLAWLTEPMRVEWNQTVILTMAWSVLALSIGAIGLLLLLIRHGAVSRAAALLYLVPPTSALIAYVLFGETLAPIQLVGMALTAAGVALASRG